MKKQRYKNLTDEQSRGTNWAAMRQMMREIRVLQKSISLDDITWNIGQELAQKINHTDKDYIAWLGHAAYLLRLNGKTWLIDPFLSERASPVQWLGPKRIVPPALSVVELPHIDYVLVTHNHYDHLDRITIKQLQKRFEPMMIVPEGLGRTLKKWRVTRITELAWQQKVTFDDVTITALPAYHYSRRGLFDLNRSWWCSFAIEFNGLKLFHSGDTGYGKNFTKIGQQFGEFDYAMIGIGAYRPQEIMKAVHITPEEAVQIALDINAKTILPMHWGTIPLTSEPFAEPIQRLWQTEAVASGRLHVALQDVGALLPL